MFRAYILAIFRELQVRCWTSESTLPTIQVLKSLAALLSVLKILFFVELRVSRNNIKNLVFDEKPGYNGSRVQACCSHAVLRLHVSFFFFFCYHKI
jgi:hypothetical protein